MATQYTNLESILLDVEIYLIAKQGGSYSLGNFPKIAENRWQWIVSKWSVFRKRFNDAAQGNSDLLFRLDDLQKDITGFSLGNRINPLSNSRSFFKYKPLLSFISIGEVGLNPDETFTQNQEIRRVLNLEEPDFRNMLTFIRQRMSTFAGEIGLGDPDASALLGLSVAQTKRPANISDLKNIDNINSVYKIIEGFIFDKQLTQKKPPNLLAAANENISEDSDFSVLDIYQTYIPVPFEISFEHMALKYLGSSQRWYELITVNNLKPPFIDNVGQKYPLLSPPSSNIAVVNNLDPSLVGPGIRVGIGSNAQREQSRVIENVIINEDSTIAITLGGAIDLNSFIPSQGAYLRVYAPSTINKNSIILIPSETPSSSGSSAKPTPKSDRIRRLSKAFIQFGVDIARDERTRDIVIDSNGNFGLAAGIKAIRQAVLNAIKTKTRELTFHPDYGLGLNIGASYFGSNSEAVIFADLIRNAVLKDLRFEDVAISKLSKTKSGIALELSVFIKGVNEPIPLAFIS